MPGRAPVYESAETTMSEKQSDNSVKEIETSSLIFSKTQSEKVGIKLALVDHRIRLAIFDAFTGGVGCNTTISLDLHPSKALELIDKLYMMLGYIENGEIIDGVLYPSKEDFTSEG